MTHHGYPHQLPPDQARWATAMFLSTARIVIADDDPDCRELLEHALRGPENEVVMATDGAELLSLLTEDGPFDLVIADLHMPRIDGDHVLEMALSDVAHTPVLIVTGRKPSTLPGALALAELDHAKILRKPFAISELRAAINELLADRT